MKTIVEPAFAALAFSVVAPGAALAAEACCRKDMKEKRSCCDEMKKGEVAPIRQPAPRTRLPPLSTNIDSCLVGERADLPGGCR